MARTYRFATATGDSVRKNLISAPLTVSCLAKPGSFLEQTNMAGAQVVEIAEHGDSFMTGEQVHQRQSHIREMFLLPSINSAWKIVGDPWSRVSCFVPDERSA